MQTSIAVFPHATHTGLMRDSPHRGVNADDARNQGVIEHFRPPEVTADHVRERLGAVMRNASPEVVDARVAEVMAKIAATPHRPGPPLSQPLEAAPDPLYGLGTHPDIIERLWAIDNALPEACRWLLWGGPALVHPDTGVVFAVGFGTIGVVVRLPPDRRDAAGGAYPVNAGVRFDISPAGPEWRFLSPRYDADQGLGLAAYEFAARSV
jgi:hypothetical protein